MRRPPRLALPCHLLLTLVAGLAGISSTAQAQNYGSGDWGDGRNYAFQRVGYYGIRNNIWGDYQRGAGWQYTWASWGNNWLVWGAESNHRNGAGYVKGYPQIVRGWSIDDGFDLSRNHGLGIKVPKINEAKVRWNFQSPNSGRHISLIDVYLHWWHTPGRSEEAALNIQLVPHVQEKNANGWLLDDSKRYGYRIGERTIGGIRYEAWVAWDHPDARAGERLMHVRPLTFTKNAEHNLLGIIRWGRDHGIVDNNMYLTSIQAGWEIIEGGSGFKTTRYRTRVNGR